jgi:hypothetical protein
MTKKLLLCLRNAGCGYGGLLLISFVVTNQLLLTGDQFVATFLMLGQKPIIIIRHERFK